MTYHRICIFLLGFAAVCLYASDSVDVYCYGGHISIKGVYWKNSVMVEPAGVKRTITKMAFSGDSFYYICDLEGAGGIVKYWRNDTATMLQSKSIAATNDIFADSTRREVLYVGGSYRLNGVNHLCYWVDGTRHEIEGSDRAFRIAGITAVDRLQTTIRKPATKFAKIHPSIRCSRFGDKILVRFDGVPERTNIKITVVDPTGRTIARYDGLNDHSGTIEYCFKSAATGVHCILLESNGIVASARVIMS